MENFKMYCYWGGKNSLILISNLFFIPLVFLAWILLILILPFGRSFYNGSRSMNWGWEVVWLQFGEVYDFFNEDWRDSEQQN